MNSEHVYINGEIIPTANAAIPLMDQGLLFGYGLFETIRVYNSMPFMLAEHLNRLESSALALDISLPGNDELKKAISHFIGCIGMNSGVIRITATKGINSPNIIFTHRNVPYSKNDYERGFSIKTSAIRRNPASPLTYFKTLNYLENVLAKKEAVREGFDEALLLNTDGLVSECSSSNIFFIKEGILHTPGLSNGLLKGIVRELVIGNLATIAGYEVFEGNYSVEEVYSYDEVFISNSVMQLMPVTRIDNCVIGNGIPGGITKKLTAVYDNLVAAYEL